MKYNPWSISEKKKGELYSALHEVIMKARIENRKKDTMLTRNDVDNILAPLCYQAAQTAIDQFKKKEK